MNKASAVEPYQRPIILTPRKFGTPVNGFPIQEDAMSQVLGIGQGKFLTFDRSWRDNGGDAQYALIGGQKVLIQGATRAKPEIFQRGDGFYYRDGTPVDNAEDVSYLPKKFRDMAEKFIKERAGSTAPMTPVATREEAVEQTVKRGRGRPKKVAPKQPLEIRDEASLRAVAGDDIG